MIIHINDNNFSWDPARIDDVIVRLDESKPFIAYPGFTRVESNGKSTSVTLDGRTSFIPNRELSALLSAVKKKLDQEAPSDSAPSP